MLSGGSVIGWDDLFIPGNAAGSQGLVAEAIRYAADNGAKVINLSLGGRGPAPTIRDAIQYAGDRGAFVAIAAGNDGDKDNPIEYPAAYGAEIDGAMTVGAVDRSRKRARYSGHRAYVEICAPGGTIEQEQDYQRGVTQVGYNEALTLPYLTPIQKLLFLRLGFRPRFDRFELVALQGTSMAAGWRGLQAGALAVGRRRGALPVRARHPWRGWRLGGVRRTRVQRRGRHRANRRRILTVARIGSGRPSRADTP